MTPEKVESLKKDLFIYKKSVKEISKQYRISSVHVARIARGESWPQILPKLTREKIIQNNTPDKIVNKIISELKNKKINQKKIAEKYNVSEYVVSRIKKKHL